MKKALSLLMISISLVALFSFPASAKNNQDTYFSFTFLAADKNGVNPDGREKQDASGTYLKYFEGTAGSAKFQVYGGDKKYFNGCTRTYNETKNDYAFVFKGQTGCISQYVYENRYTHYNTSMPYAFLAAYVDIVDGGVMSTAKGYWSPDTLGSFPYFNR